jgi:hypothetical protein
MNPDTPKQRLQHQQAHEHTSEQQQTAEQQTGLAFDSVEELLRHDAANTTPPLSIAARLKVSLEQEPVRKRSWWQRLFAPRASG